MAVKIRLARFGRNKIPFYHIVATDSRNRRDSKFLEKLGTFNPLLDDSNKEKLRLNVARAEYWIGVGAEPTERAALLLIKSNVKGAEKFKPTFTPREKGTGLKKKGLEAAKLAAAKVAETATAAAQPVTTEAETIPAQ
ncbi:MAG: 30S ribosomal protein S16 [Rickettsiales bacterium]|jgi:small subunit ribosomal protein S16|nr:30S ribosomal protein S16 [Rickettsiales bacterium]